MNIQSQALLQRVGPFPPRQTSIRPVEPGGTTSLKRENGAIWPPEAVYATGDAGASTGRSVARSTARTS